LTVWLCIVADNILGFADSVC